MAILIFVPVSRENRIQHVKETIASLEKPAGDKIHVLIVADNYKIEPFKTKYRTTFINTGLGPPTEFDVHLRRLRISNSFNLASKLINRNYKYVFTFEDDSVLDSDTLIQLIRTYEGYDKKFNIGFVSGVQAGRWASKMIGVWDGNTDRIYTLPFKNGIIEKVKACGFYAFLTTKYIFQCVPFRTSFFGPDVNFGFDLIEKGFVNLVNYNIKIGHLLNSGEILYPDKTVQTIEYFREGQRWKLEGKTND
jgi:hypothetical protein